MTYKLTQGWPQHIESGAFVNPETNQQYLDWLANGNIPEKADNALTITQNKVAELKQKLIDTDYKVLPDYDRPSDEIRVLRQLWRNEIRQLEAQQC